jgi:hypothetical protein
MQSRILVVGIALVLAACGGASGSAPPAASATAGSSGSPTPAVTSASSLPSTTPASSAEATAPESSASQAALALAVAAMLRPTVEGIRVRASPGSTGEMLATMPLDALGMIELGPLPRDGYDWYLLRYSFLNASGATDGGVGWVASGPTTSPWLVPAEDAGWYTGLVAGDAGTGPGVAGPIEIADWNHGVRWAAVGTACPLDININDASIVSTDVNGFAEGEVQSQFFVEHPELVGTVSIEIASDCSWALSVVRYQG